RDHAPTKEHEGATEVPRKVAAEGGKGRIFQGLFHWGCWVHKGPKAGLKEEEQVHKLLVFLKRKCRTRPLKEFSDRTDEVEGVVLESAHRFHRCVLLQDRRQGSHEGAEQRVTLQTASHVITERGEG